MTIRMNSAAEDERRQNRLYRLVSVFGKHEAEMAAVDMLDGGYKEGDVIPDTFLERMDGMSQHGVRKLREWGFLVRVPGGVVGTPEFWRRIANG